MAQGRLQFATERGTISTRSVEERAKGVWRWVSFSCVLHAIFIWILFVVPRLPLRSAPSYPIYTVDLVGGEKLGGVIAGSEIAPPPEAKKESKKAKEEAPPPPKVAKESKKKAPEARAEMTEKTAAIKAKKEKVKEEPAEQDLPSGVRDRLIQAALERVKGRAESEEKKQKAPPVSSGPAVGQGAATPGAGGAGGGSVKSFEFVRYHNSMIQRIKNSWTWVGRGTDLEVTVRFAIEESGEVSGLRLVRGSGDSSYDDSVMRAVTRAKLPPPPENYRKDFMDVELTFRPKDLRS